MGKAKRLIGEEQQCIKHTSLQRKLKTQISYHMQRSVSVINRFLKDTSKYGKKYKGSKPKLNSIKKRLIIRKAKRSSMPAKWLYTEFNSNKSTRYIQQIISVGSRLKQACKIQALFKKALFSMLSMGKGIYQFERFVERCNFSDEKKFNLNGPHSY